MMGHQSRQMAMIFVDIESLIPETHLLRKIERMVSFDFIYDLLAPYYPATGRPSVGPVSMFKMLLIGYLYGIKSERRLVEEVQLNIAYRWFCGFELDDTIPNHSTFSKTRTRKWQQSSLFQKAFYEIVKQCIDSGLIDGEAMAADGSYIPANVSRESWINVETEVEQSTRSRAMPVCAVQNGRAVLTRLEFGAECWPAVVIRHFSEGISAWELLNSCP